MSHTVKLDANSEARYAVRHIGTGFYLTLNKGKVLANPRTATVYETYEGAEGLARRFTGSFGPTEIVLFDMIVRFTRIEPSRSEVIQPHKHAHALTDVERRACKIIAEQLGHLESQVTPDKSFRVDLNADSLDEVELTMAIEDEFGIEITDDEAESCITVQDVFDFLKRNAFRIRSL